MTYTIDERVRTSARLLGGEFCVSKRGTPHVLVEIDEGVEASVCYFASSKTWRVYYPFGLERRHQEVTTHNTIEEVETRLQEIEER